MTKFSYHRLLIWAILCSIVLLAGCRNNNEPPSRWEEVQETTAAGGQATNVDSLPGGDFNQFFPKSEGAFEVIYIQEKQGFAEATLQKGGQEEATLSVTDTVNNPDALQKYTESTQTAGIYPLAAVGSQGSAILVGGRFQVQIRSKSDTFSEADRLAWLEKFDLTGLSQLGSNN